MTILIGKTYCGICNFLLHIKTRDWYNVFMRVITNKNDLMKSIETKLGGDIEEVLRIMYVDKSMPVKHIASTLGITYLTAHRWIKRAGIYSRYIDLEG